MVFKKRTAYKSRKSGSTSRSRKLNSRRLRQHMKQRRLRSRRGRVHRVGGDEFTVTVRGKNLTTSKKAVIPLTITTSGKLLSNSIECTDLLVKDHFLTFSVDGTKYKYLLDMIIAELDDEDNYNKYMKPLLDNLGQSELFKQLKYLVESDDDV